MRLGSSYNKILFSGPTFLFAKKKQKIFYSTKEETTLMDKKLHLSIENNIFIIFFQRAIFFFAFSSLINQIIFLPSPHNNNWVIYERGEIFNLPSFTPL